MERDSCEEAVLIEGAEIFLRRVDDGAVAVLAGKGVGHVAVDFFRGEGFLFLEQCVNHRMERGEVVLAGRSEDGRRDAWGVVLEEVEIRGERERIERGVHCRAMRQLRLVFRIEQSDLRKEQRRRDGSLRLRFVIAEDGIWRDFAASARRRRDVDERQRGGVGAGEELVAREWRSGEERDGLARVHRRSSADGDDEVSAGLLCDACSFITGFDVGIARHGVVKDVRNLVLRERGDDVILRAIPLGGRAAGDDHRLFPACEERGMMRNGIGFQEDLGGQGKMNR